MDTDEVCPSCGNIDTLNEITGWCPPCSGVIPTQQFRCVRCKKEFSSARAEFICVTCKTEEWANEIEVYMGTYKVSYTKAKLLVAKGNQAVCLCCGDTMPRATKGRHNFCSKTKCKSASRRVKHLRNSKSLTHSQALDQVLRELHAENKTAA